MGTTTLVSIQEYLSSVYEPDRDYVDGVLEERNVGEKPHSRLQKKLITQLDRSGFDFVYPALRLQVASTRYRVPDLCVYLAEPEDVPTIPPVLAIEILSPEDRWSRVQLRVQDLATWGCPCVWVLDPQLKKAFRFDGAIAVPVTDELAHPSIPELRLQLADVFPR